MIPITSPKALQASTSHPQFSPINFDVASCSISSLSQLSNGDISVSCTENHNLYTSYSLSQRSDAPPIRLQRQSSSFSSVVDAGNTDLYVSFPEALGPCKTNNHGITGCYIHKETWVSFSTNNSSPSAYPDATQRSQRLCAPAFPATYSVWNSIFAPSLNATLVVEDSPWLSQPNFSRVSAYTDRCTNYFAVLNGTDECQPYQIDYDDFSATVLVLCQSKFAGYYDPLPSRNYAVLVNATARTIIGQYLLDARIGTDPTILHWSPSKRFLFLNSKWLGLSPFWVLDMGRNLSWPVSVQPFDNSHCGYSIKPSMMVFDIPRNELYYTCSAISSGNLMYLLKLNATKFLEPNATQSVVTVATSDSSDFAPCDTYGPLTKLTSNGATDTLILSCWSRYANDQARLFALNLSAAANVPPETGATGLQSFSSSTGMMSSTAGNSSSFINSTFGSSTGGTKDLSSVTNPPQQLSTWSDGGLSAGGIVGITLAAIFLVLAVLFFLRYGRQIYYRYKLRNRRMCNNKDHRDEIHFPGLSLPTLGDETQA